MTLIPWEPEAVEWLRQYKGPKQLKAQAAAFNQAAAEKGWHPRTAIAVRVKRYQKARVTWRKYRNPVICVETGVVYDNAEAAAKPLHVCPATIRVAIYRGNKCQGFHWKYVEPETPSADMPSDN